MNTPESWPRCPETAAFFETQYRVFAAANPPVAQMEARFRNDAGVNILNLIDHWQLPASSALRNELTACGLSETQVDGDLVWEHPLARFPRVRLLSHLDTPRLALAVEDVRRFVRVHQSAAEGDRFHGFAPHGFAPHGFAPYEEALISLPAGELAVVARCGYKGFRAHAPDAAQSEALLHAHRLLLDRPREGDEQEVIAHTHHLLEQIIGAIGQDQATDAFFMRERDYYEDRNSAAAWQYGQQNRLGFGWANHDHHTYRSSRESFRALMQLFLLLGFEMRERFYAGAEAGWGAQILEHPVSRVVIFADVDMAPEELDIDFASVDLPSRTTLGTIGLWCALHGSSIACAGLHHLEAEFDFERVKANLEAAGHAVMPPFTDLPMLKQAFTVAETWQVAPERVQTLLAQSSITREQADKFLTHGAPGSHLEILQRWDGFKGFNKTGVSNIIRDTDARKHI